MLDQLMLIALLVPWAHVTAQFNHLSVAVPNAHVVAACFWWWDQLEARLAVHVPACTCLSPPSVALVRDVGF
jgi:hypothetical protein